MTPYIFVGLNRRSKEHFLIRRYILKESTILESIIEQTGVPLRNITSQSRKAVFVEARHIAAGLLREHTNLTLKEIGTLIGGRDHSTMLYSIKTYNRFMDIDKTFREKVEKIKAKLCGS